MGEAVGGGINGEGGELVQFIKALSTLYVCDGCCDAMLWWQLLRNVVDKIILRLSILWVCVIVELDNTVM